MYRLFVVLGSVFLGACSIQEDITRHDLRLAELESARVSLERRVSSVEQSGQHQEQTLRGQLAESRAELERIKADVAQLQGRIEESQYALNKRLTETDDQGRLARLENDLTRSLYRVQAIEAYLNLEVAEPPAGASAQVPAGPVPTAGGGAQPPQGGMPPAPPASPDELYAAAKRDFDRGALEGARSGFERLLSLHPKSKLAGNAQFWLGETYYREQWYEKAILEYQKVIENYPDSNKIEACLLKQGLAFFNLGDKANARLILKELIRKYPKSNEAQIARQKVKETD
jgi:tol-pal system protein YbgF